MAGSFVDEHVLISDDALNDFKSMSDTIVERRNRYMEKHGHADATIEVSVQLRVDTKSGKIIRVYPVIKDGKAVRLSIMTDSGWMPYGELCDKKGSEFFKFCGQSANDIRTVILDDKEGGEST